MVVGSDATPLREYTLSIIGDQGLCMIFGIVALLLD